MKKIILVALMALGITGAAAGVAQAYPPTQPTVTVSVLSPIVGSTVTVSYDGCLPADTATFTLGSSTATAPVQNGVATASLPVPTTPGVVQGSVACSSGAAGATFEVNVVPATTDGLPATGGSGITQSLQIALILLAMGGGIFGVTQVRRRQTVDA